MAHVESGRSSTKRDGGSLPSPAEQRARSVIGRLRERGYKAYLAGGCVRDWLRGAAPSDFDVATDAAAEDVQGLFERTVPVGIQFGVVLVVVDGQPVEVATFRSDAEYLDGRHPVSVRPATPQEDARRRDFTVNGMFLDPDTTEVLDYVDGQQDIDARLIRAIGDPEARFGEDHLRMLRAVRLAARLDYAIEPQTFAAIERLAPRINSIAAERIGEEIVRILTEGGARRGFELLDQCGLLQQVLPEVVTLKGVQQSPDFHPEGDVFRHTLLLLQGLDQLGPERASEHLALGALLHDIAKPACAARKGDRITFYGHTEVGEKMAVEICQRLKRSRVVWEKVGYLVRNHLRSVEMPNMRRSTLRRFLSEDGIGDLLELVRLDSLASSRDLSGYELFQRSLAQFENEPVRPPPLLTGRDLLRLGYAEGPLCGEILRAVEDRQLEGELGSRDEALAWVTRTYPLNI